MWATVLVVYFIKFVYTVRMKGSIFFLTGTTSEAVVVYVEELDFCLLNVLLCVHDR